VTLHRILALGAAIAGFCAALVGSPQGNHGTSRGAIDVARLAAAVAHEQDHVTALQLAEWIRDGNPGLRVIDLRSAAEYDAFHIPRSERVPLESLAAKRLDPAETIVVISGGGAHAAQAWVFLQALGYRHSYSLRAGIQEWLDDVMNPTLAADAPAAEKAAFSRVSALSRYFGGTPRVGGSTTTTFDAPPRSGGSTVADLRRRGC
jgi:rhodanese-related sulfurtransferase